MKMNKSQIFVLILRYKYKKLDIKDTKNKKYDIIKRIMFSYRILKCDLCIWWSLKQYSIEFLRKILK